MNKAVEDLARHLCDQDSAMADAVADTVETAAKCPEWPHSNEERREYFRTMARVELA